MSTLAYYCHWERRGTGKRSVKFIIQAITREQASSIRTLQLFAIYRRISSEFLVYSQQLQFITRHLPDEISKNPTTILQVRSLNIMHLPGDDKIIDKPTSQYENSISVYSKQPNKLVSQILICTHFGLIYEIHPKFFTKSTSVQLSSLHSIPVLSITNLPDITPSQLIDILHTLPDFNILTVQLVF